MVKHLRVDERLIHGQVATVWVNTLRCDRIIVANDDAIKDEMQIAALKIATPTGMKLSLLSINKAAENIMKGNYDGDQVFLIVKNIKDLKRIIDAGLKIENVNIGNISKKEGTVEIKRTVHLSKEDIEIINGLLDSGINITARMLPNETSTSIREMLP